jgi:Putative bacterial sensory transduction regulator
MSRTGNEFHYFSTLSENSIMSNKNQENATETSDELLLSLTSERVSEAIKAAGCAVSIDEQDGVVRLHSASQGIGFQVLWGNKTAEGEYIDLTLSCPLRVQYGALPDGLLAEWHRSNRFARVAQHGDFVVLEMDVVAAGGISPNHLAMMMRLWSQMMGQFFLHLRNFKAQNAAMTNGSTPSMEDAPKVEPVAV